VDLLDKVIQEWSYRTNKGYPDINSKHDMDLFESMFGFRLDSSSKQIQDQKQNSGFDRVDYYKQYFTNLAPSPMQVARGQNSIVISNIVNNKTLSEQEETEISVDSIIDLVRSNKDNQKLLKRVYRTLSSTSDVDRVKKLLNKVGIDKNTFSDRNLPAEIVSILLGGSTNNIKEFLKSTTSTFNPNSTGRTVEYFDENFPKQKISALSGLDGYKDGVAMGKGEILFPLLFSNVKLNKTSAGDFVINGKIAELKKSPSARLSGSRKNVAYEPYYNEAKGSWAESINKDFKLGKQRGEVEQVVKTMNNFIKQTYPKSTVFVQPSSKTPVIDFAKAAVDSYIRKKEIEVYILFDSKTGKYRSFSPATGLLDAIEDGSVKLGIMTNPQIRSFS